MNVTMPAVRPTYGARKPAAATTAEVQPRTPNPATPIKPQAGGRSGVGGVLVGLLLNGWGPISGLISIGNDLRELKNDPNHHTAHAIEVAGDVMNIASGLVGLASAQLGFVLSVAGMLVKTTGEMMAGKD